LRPVQAKKEMLSKIPNTKNGSSGRVPQAEGMGQARGPEFTP
jgi:hypothetical protein